jgi:hypothetical protein
MYFFRDDATRIEAPSMTRHYSGKDTVGKQAKDPAKELNRPRSSLHRASLRNRPISGIKLLVYGGTDLH